jgi:hypothetical protein
MRVEGITVVKIPMFVFCVVKPCGHWVHTNVRRQYVPPKRWYVPTSPPGVITQKTNTDKIMKILETRIRKEIVWLQYRNKRYLTSSVIWLL